MTRWHELWANEPRSAVNAESNNASWGFFVNHYQNETQARRDNKYTYLRSNGSYYVGLDPPEDAEPYVPGF